MNFSARRRRKPPRGVRGMLSRKTFKVNASKMAEMHPNTPDAVNNFVFYHANKHEI